ncbi:MAG: hypothetical protein ACK56F_25280, partial [bacterium]
LLDLLHRLRVLCFLESFLFFHFLLFYLSLCRDFQLLGLGLLIDFLILCLGLLRLCLSLS